MSALRLKLSGDEIIGLIDASVTKNIETFCGNFSVTVVTDDLINFPVRRGAEAQILAGDIPIITGIVQRITIQYGPDNHTIIFQGRDKTSHIVDNSIVGNIELVAPVTLKQVVQKVLDSYGLLTFIEQPEVIEETDIEPFAQGEIVSAAVGQNAWDFIETYARKRQVLVTTNGDGNIVLTRGSQERIQTFLLHELNGQQNNIKNATMIFDDTERFNAYVIKTQGNTSGRGVIINPGTIANGQDGIAFDTDIDTVRQLVVIAENASNGQTTEERATWEANIRRERSQIYSCQIQGFLAQEDGIVWQPNLLVPVIDDFAQINGDLLIRSVTYNSTLGGSTTDIELVTPDAYSLAAEQDEIEARTNKLGVNL